MWYVKLAIIIVNSVDLYAEFTSPAVGIDQSLLVPVAITSLYIFIGTQLITSIFKREASRLFQCYSLIVCIFIEIAIFFLMFSEYQMPLSQKKRSDSGIVVINLLSPIVLTLLLFIELFVMLMNICMEYAKGTSPHHGDSGQRANYSFRTAVRNILNDCAG